MPTTVKKVATPKSAVKKTVTKKVASVTKKTQAKKSTSAQSLVYADNDHSFWVQDGQILNSLKALRDAFTIMDKATFSHHVTKDKNDFADWVESVLCDASCAVDLRKAKTTKTAVTVVTKHLTRYQA